MDFLNLWMLLNSREWMLDKDLKYRIKFDIYLFFDSSISTQSWCWNVIFSFIDWIFALLHWKWKKTLFRSAKRKIFNLNTWNVSRSSGTFSQQSKFRLNQMKCSVYMRKLLPIQFESFVAFQDLNDCNYDDWDIYIVWRSFPNDTLLSRWKRSTVLYCCVFMLCTYVRSSMYT